MYVAARYFLYFVAYSLLGGVAETLYGLLFWHRLYLLHGFMNLPIVPIYGFGMTLVIVLLESHKRHPVHLFAASTVVVAILEFVTSWLLEALFHMRIWDYSGVPFNLDGRVSLWTSVTFGLGSLVIIYFIHPYLSKLVGRIPRWITITTSAIVGGVLLTMFVITLIGHIK